MKAPLDSARAVVTAARAVYASDPAALSELDELEARLDQPLRVALVGSVKAGKSTLLNGLLCERIAPTDARECTRIVTWYRQGPTPSVRAQHVDGGSTTLPAKRHHDRLELDLQGLSADELDRLEVTWPAPGLTGITLIDTPGTSSISHEVSAQTDSFLLPEQGAAGADAIVYLLRSLHESDVRLLRALHERTRHGNAAVGAVAVLSRADELGAGRLTAMVSINRAVERLRNHPSLEGVCETVVPVAGLMGLGATTLRQSDFTVFRSLAGRDRDETRKLLISAERFITTDNATLPSEKVRADLVDRFGIYGIRLALAVVRGGVSDATELSTELVRRSGLEELRRVLDVNFAQRQPELKAHSIVLAVHRLVRGRPVPGSADLLVMADDHLADAHAFREMQLLGRIVAGRVGLGADHVRELERIVGGRGASPHDRLGISPDDITPEGLVERAVEHLRRWRELCENPLLDPETLDACRVAQRSCEAIVAAAVEGSPERVSTPA
ncbi:dynamin family protein [Aeromicrobium sp. CF4.19]|uniref:dynamin family protein n=1 Tax=Aeromicrobium sp. CF4.19 TaxID=3373082 RepID=UPI003EE4289C